MIDTKNWREFSLISLFGDAIRGTRIVADDRIPGNIAFVTAGESNQGVSDFICNAEAITYENALTIDMFGNCFYHDYSFKCDDNCLVLQSKNLNPLVGNFVATVINQDLYRNSYGRQYRQKDYVRHVISLPATVDGHKYTPDWAYMEQFMRQLSHKSITTQIQSPHIPLETEKWGEFRIGDLFDAPYKAKAHTKDEFDVAEIGDVRPLLPYVTRTDENNAVDLLVVNTGNIDGIEVGNALVIGDTTATISYQAESFVCGDHIVILRANWLNVLTGLFIKTILQNEQFRYSYGRAFTMDLISNTVVRLPMTVGGEPDWYWVESYMQSLPYSDKIESVVA